MDDVPDDVEVILTIIHMLESLFDVFDRLKAVKLAQVQLSQK